jgi:hypothetical protein
MACEERGPGELLGAERSTQVVVAVFSSHTSLVAPEELDEQYGEPGKHIGAPVIPPTPP